MKILENFAVLEGIDGSGTTTQLKILEKSFLREQNRLLLPPIYTTFEPTNGIIGRIIRSALKKETQLCANTIALLFAADRNEHIYGPQGIKERCARGELVVSDRYLPSSLVYQGITCGNEFPAMLNRGFPCPELLLFLDIDIESAEERLKSRNLKEIYEYREFQIQVRERYKALLPQFRENGVRVEVIDASAPANEVAAEVWNSIQKMRLFQNQALKKAQNADI